jgi:hypothetical protein
MSHYRDGEVAAIPARLASSDQIRTTSVLTAGNINLSAAGSVRKPRLPLAAHEGSAALSFSFGRRLRRADVRSESSSGEERTSALNDKYEDSLLFHRSREPTAS